MRFVTAFLALVLAASPVAPSAGEGQPFITAGELDLTRLLPAPPETDSRETKAELGRVLSIQVVRTPDMEERAVADGLQDISRFADVLGTALPKESLPKAWAFFDRLEATEAAVTDPSKAVWGRPRPYQLSDLVRPVGRMSKSGSYPSGHATFGTLMGIVLAEMVPERRPEIMRRAREYANSRLVAGLHFPSDIEAGRIAGTAIAAIIMSRDDFRAGFAEAKAELRAALDLPVASP